jgi:hypothetical protein
MYPCPVCGYDRMEFPAEPYNICPCCGTEFGYEDFADTYAERVQRWAQLRRRWLENDAPWFSPVDPSPPGWSPYAQLLRAGLAAFSSSEARTESSTVEFLEVA